MKDSEILLLGAVLFPVVWFACKWFYRSREHKMDLEFERIRTEMANSHFRYINKIVEDSQQ